MMNISDEILIRKTLEGDDSAFCALINKHGGVVHGLCYHLVHNFADAADLAQEAFIKAYFKLSSLADPTRFPSWLRQITTNICRDWLRRQKNDTLSFESMSGNPSTSSSPEEICESEELQRKVAEAISSLSEKNRQAVTLYYLDGRSCDEVADFLDVSTSVVQSRLFEARKQLRKELLEMVKDDLESRKLSPDFEEKILNAIEKAKSAKNQYEYNEVVKYCDEALEILDKLPDSVEHKKTKKEALWLKGSAVNRHEHREDAIKFFEEALEIEKEVGDLSSQAHLIAAMGTHYANYGDKKKAAEYYKNALDIFTRLNIKSGQADVLHSYASLSISAFDIEEAKSYYQRAFELYTEVDNKRQAASCHAGVKLLNQFGSQIKEMTDKKGPDAIASYASICESFKVKPDSLTYHEYSATKGSFIHAHKEYKVDTSPYRFCFLPGRMKFLTFPPVVGHKWSERLPSGGKEPMKITVSIESDSETITVSAGTFSNCLKTRLITSEEPEDSDRNRTGEREFFYAPGVGLVKTSLIRRDGTIHITQLAHFHISDDKEDYFPLSVGNKWTYQWADETGEYTSTDVYEVSGIDNYQYYISRYYYAVREL